jgi:hypothetical protein
VRSPLARQGVTLRSCDKTLSCARPLTHARQTDAHRKAASCERDPRHSPSIATGKVARCTCRPLRCRVHRVRTQLVRLHAVARRS